MNKFYLNGSSGKMGQIILNISKKYDFIEENSIEASDVVIDFSHPSSIDNITYECVLKNKPLVIGTTGLSNENYLTMKKASQKIPILYASNFSNGILALKKSILDFLMNSDDKYHCVIEEVHHNQKKDFPSGTAFDIRSFINTNDKKNLIKSLKITSIREGDIFGVHKIFFNNEEQNSCFKHEALSREAFASGALISAKKILALKPNLYSIEEF